MIKTNNTEYVNKLNAFRAGKITEADWQKFCFEVLSEALALLDEVLVHALEHLALASGVLGALAAVLMALHIHALASWAVDAMRLGAEVMAAVACHSIRGGLPDVLSKLLRILVPTGTPVDGACAAVYSATPNDVHIRHMLSSTGDR